MTIDFDSEPPEGEPEAARAARAFVAGERDEPGRLPDDVADALVAALVERGDAARLERLASTPDKALAKRGRRGLHLLRARGVRVEVPRAASPAAPRAASVEAEPPSLVSAWLRDGERVLWLARTGGDGRVEIYQVQETEREGLVAFDAMIAARRNWRALVHEYVADAQLAVAPVDGALVRWWIEQAAERSTSVGRRLPREFSEARFRLGPVLPPPRHPALDAVDEASVAAAPRDRIASVIELPETVSWIPSEEEAQAALLALAEVATSTLVIDERQREQQANEALRRAARQALAGPWRDRLAARLRDTALLILRRAAVGRPGRDYAGDAALCLAAAEQVADPAVAPDDVVVARALFERLRSAVSGAAAADAAMADEPPREITTESGLILPSPTHAR